MSESSDARLPRPDDPGDVEIQAEESASSAGAGDGDDDNDGIRLVPFTSKEHGFKSALMTFKEYHFPENLLAPSTFIGGGIYGVAAVDAASDDLAGYYVGKTIPSLCGGVGFGRKKVANLAQICVSSKYQKRGIAQRMGKFMLEGDHPDFDPDDYDEIIVQDTDVFNSPSWLFSDRCGFRYFPMHDVVRRLGLSGYYHLELTYNHILPGQYLKRLVRSDEEAALADDYESQRGVLACLVSGLLPCAYYVLHYVLVCGVLGRDPNGVFAAYVYGAVYVMLAARFLLAHALTSQDSSPPAFRYYEFWWGTFGGALGHVLTILQGFPLLGWTGGFYIGLPNINYKKKEHQRAIALMYLPICLFSLALFLAHTMLRVFRPGVLADIAFVDVLGTVSFFFSVTDVAFFFPAFPSGAVSIRRWNAFAYAALLLSWLALLIVTLVVPDDGAHVFLDLSAAACVA